MDRAHRLLVSLAAAVLGIAAPIAAGTALAQQPAAEDCDKAAWSLASARARLAAPARTVEAGARLSLPLDGAVALVLSDRASAGLPFPPMREGRAPNAGFARLAVPEPGGIFQVTVSEGAWLDVFAAGKPLSPLAFTGVHACPGVRKSLRFRLPQGEAVLVVTDAAGTRIALVVDPMAP